MFWCAGVFCVYKKPKHQITCGNGRLSLSAFFLSQLRLHLLWRLLRARGAFECILQSCATVNQCWCPAATINRIRVTGDAHAAHPRSVRFIGKQKSVLVCLALLDSSKRRRSNILTDCCRLGEQPPALTSPPYLFLLWHTSLKSWKCSAHGHRQQLSNLIFTTLEERIVARGAQECDEGGFEPFHYLASCSSSFIGS